MGKGWSTIALLTVAALVQSVASAQTTVRGTVTDAKTGKAIANLTVGASRKQVIAGTPAAAAVQAEKTATTNENGQYSIEVPAGVNEIGVFTLSDTHVNEIYDGVPFGGGTPRLDDFKREGVKPVDASADTAGIDFRLEPLGASPSAGSNPAGKKAEKDSSGANRSEDIYYTDTHGAAGVLHAMLSLGQVDEKYMECAHQTLAWLIHIKKADAQGRVTWYLTDPPAPGDPNRAIQLPGVAPIVARFFDAYAQTQRPEYKDTGLAAARWLAEVGADQWETPLGVAYGWPFFPSQKKDVGLVSGHSHGLGNYTESFTRAYTIQSDAAFEKALTGILVNLKTRAVAMDGERLAWPAYKWPNLKDKDAFLTGYCYGQAGVIIPLLDLAKLMPNLKLQDGTTPLHLANGALRYLMGQAQEAEGGYVWPYMRWSKESKNPGLGSGVGGIGWAFLRGYQLNREIGNAEFATECAKYARGAAVYALSAIESAPADTVFRAGGGPTGFGVCGAVGGAAWFPKLLAEELGAQDPTFVERTRNAMRRLAHLLIVHATPVGNTLAWKMPPGEKITVPHPFTADSATVNMALDYGQTGVVLALAETGKYLNDEEILAAARKAADFVVDNAVKTEHGWKFARFVRLERQATAPGGGR